MTRKDSSMSTTTEPQVGEWWWVEHRFTSRPVPARWMEGGGWHCPSGWLAAEHAVPLSRIPDPPAPEPTEAEKVDARRASIVRHVVTCDEWAASRVAQDIRWSDEQAGYVLVPTSGEGFERRLTAAKRATVYRGDIYSPATVMVEDGIRAFLEAAKGDAR